MMIRYDLDYTKLVDEDINVTIMNVVELVNCTLGTVFLPDEQSEQGFLEGPMAKFYTKVEMPYEEQELEGLAPSD